MLMHEALRSFYSYMEDKKDADESHQEKTYHKEKNHR